MNRTLCAAAFVAGLTAVIWIGAGYVGSSVLALAMTALIGVVYLAGAGEMLRFHRATLALCRTVSAVPENLSHLGEWLDRLPPSLQNPVRLRIEGERVGLPGPALTPYLVGLLVLLGMLGTFLGMVVTLNGAVVALEGTPDLAALRASLAAPIKGLGVAFGTSVAGVTASAMLGLVSALCRRERVAAAQLLDTKIATVLRGFSLAHQRRETFDALRSQAGALPQLVNTLQAMIAQLGQHSRETDERQRAEQERFYRDAKTTYSELAASVDVSLRNSLVESARVAGATVEPLVAATTAAIARETAALHERLADTVARQLEGISARFDASITRVEATWTAAVAAHERSGERLTQQLEHALAGYGDTFAQRSASLLSSVERSHSALQAELVATTADAVEHATARHVRLADTLEARFDRLAERVDATVAAGAERWTAVLADHERATSENSAQAQRSLDAVADAFAQRSAALVTTVEASAMRLQAEFSTTEHARAAALTATLESVATSLADEWRQAGIEAQAREERICAALDDTAGEIAAAARAQAGATIDEVAALMRTAADAPRAAAEVVGELRRELSASIARDNDLLAERARIMQTLGALLDAINHASTEQRDAIDALVASSAALLERAGSRFEQSVDTHSATLGDAAAELAGGAIEVASLGEAFGAGVQRFGESNERLVTTLARIEGALEKSATRSDEQLAYYVAQAREIIDLSILSQRQIVDDLQRRSGSDAPVADEV